MMQGAADGRPPCEGAWRCQAFSKPQNIYVIRIYVCTFVYIYIYVFDVYIKQDRIQAAAEADRADRALRRAPRRIPCECMHVHMYIYIYKMFIMCMIYTIYIYIHKNTHRYTYIHISTST